MNAVLDGDSFSVLFQSAEQNRRLQLSLHHHHFALITMIKVIVLFLSLTS